MILIGKVKTGLGEGSFWMKKAEEAFEKKIGLKMFNGTLNIELDKDFILEGKMDIMSKDEYGGTQNIFIKECNILGHKSYIIRTDKNISEKIIPCKNKFM